MLSERPSNQTQNNQPMPNITKEAVLRAAKKSTPEEALKELFPQYFEEEDTLAIKKGTFSGGKDDNLMAFCEKAFDDRAAILIANGLANRNQARLRSLYVSSIYEVRVLPSTPAIGTTIEIHHRK